MNANISSYIAPLAYTGDRETAHHRLLALLSRLPRVTIVDTDPVFIHAEFRSRLFQFVDDVLFHFPEKENQIHLRSSSRKGYWDLGANRRRLEHIRRLFMKSEKTC
ncbi:MAG: DUF1499 domain-containing protein [Desulfobacteraceae bacterium]|nr:DUF1499 domain-containing protein [Desulfobacteraceae bacterium]